jgi:hypothetical protein
MSPVAHQSRQSPSRLSVGGVALLCATLGWAEAHADRAELDQMTGHWLSDQAVLAWTTRSEIGVAGFRVSRQQPCGRVQPLHAEWLPPASFPWGGAGQYHVVDSEARRNETVTYRLEQINWAGDVSVLGEWGVTFNEDSFVAVTGISEPPTLPAQQSGEGAALALKLPVSARDVFAVSYASLATGFDLSSAEVADRAADGEWAMRCGDEPVAYLNDAARERLLFYGWPVSNRYTRTNVFWIEPGIGQLMQQLASEPIALATNPTFISHVRHEVDQYTLINHPVDREDRRYWDFLIAAADVTATSQKSFSLPLPGYAGSDVELTVQLVGLNEATAYYPNHHVEVHFHGNDLAEDIVFNGRADVAAPFVVPAGSVNTNNGLLTLRALLPEAGGYLSYVGLDYFEVGYVREIAPGADPLIAADGGWERFAAHGFADPLVLDITQPHQPRWVADVSGELDADDSWPLTAGTTWLFREHEDIEVVEPVPGGEGAWLRDTTNAVDYLVIAPREFAAPAQALATYRQGQGLRTAVAFYEDLCDQFYGGVNAPDAIRAALVYAYAEWQAAPWLVVLAGNSHYDYMNVGGFGPVRMPAPLVSTQGGFRPFDGWYADVQEPVGVPDLAIGRLPVASVQQFEDYLTKLQTYEAAGETSGHVQSSFVAGLPDGAGDFTATNADLGAIAADRYGVTYLNRSDLSLPGLQAALVQSFTNGSGVIHYTGHGSIQQLSSTLSEALFDVTSAAGLVNDPVPLFISLTCMIGRFDYPDKQSLAEALLLNPDGGALAVFAPSGLSWNDPVKPLGEAFYAAHAQAGGNTVGTTLLAARQSLGTPDGYLGESLKTYNLLGDPAIKLQGGTGGPPPVWVDTYAQWRWENFDMATLSNADTTAPDADPEEQGESNFAAYAFGSEGPRVGLSPGAATTGVTWPQRPVARDVQYQVWMTGDLSEEWQAVPGDWPVAVDETTADGLQRMRLEVQTDTNRLFFHVQAVGELP